MNTKHCIFTQGVRVVGRGLIYLLGVTCAAHLMTAAAADIWWTNTSGGNWNVAANWSPNQVPGALDDVSIPNYTVTVTDAEAVNGLTLGSDGQGSPRLNLTASASIVASGPLNWASGVISGGVVECNGGSLSGAGDSTMVLNGLLVNAGPLTWGGSGNNLVFSSGTLTNLAAGTITIVADANSAYYGAGDVGTIGNAGVLRKTGTPGTTTLGTPFVNTGDVQVESGELDLNSGGSASGTFEVSANGTLRFDSGSYTLSSGSSITGAGTVWMAGATVTETGSLYLSGTNIISGGTLTVNAPATMSVTDLILSGGTLGGTSLVMVSGPLNWTGGGITGVVEFNGGTFSQSDPARTLDLNGGQLINNGTLSWTDVQMRTGNGSIINNLASGIINLTPNNGGGGAFGGSYVFNNAGQVTMTGSGAATIADTFNNSGTVSVNSGELDLPGGGSDSGAFTIASGATLGLNGHTHTLNDGTTFTGAGNLIINGATVNFTGSASMNVNTLVLSSGAVNFNNSGANAAAVVNFSAGTLGGTSLVMVSGPLNWTGGGITGVVEFNGGTFSGNMDLYGGQLINNGTLTWTVNQMRTGNGSIINNLANGIINLTPNSVVSADFGGTYVFNNAGQVTMTGPGTARIDDTFNNSGTVSVQSGTLALSGGGTESGPFTVASGATLNLSGGTFTFNPTSIISGAGNFMVSGATATLGNSLSAQGTYTFSGGTVNFTGSASMSGNTLVLSGGTVNFNNSGANAAAVFNFSNGTLGGTSPVVVSGPLNWTGGTIYGVVEFNGGTFSGLSGSMGLNSGQLINNGTLSWTGAQLGTANGSIINNLASGIINLTPNSFASPVSGATDVFNNAGQVTMTGSGTASIGDTFNNSGRVSVNSGELDLTGSGSDSGAFTIASGATLGLAGGTRTLNDGTTFTGAGNLIIKGATANFAGSASMSVNTLVLSGGTVNFNNSGANTAAVFNFSNGTLGGTSPVVVSGPLNWTGGGLPAWWSLMGELSVATWTCTVGN